MRLLLVLVLCLSSLGLLCPVWAQAPTQYTITEVPAFVVRRLATGSDLVVGDVRDGSGRQVAAILAPPSARRILGTLPDGLSSTANGACGQLVVGTSSTGPLALFSHAFKTAADFSLLDLGTLGDARLASAATDCNAAGVIVGYGDSADGRSTVALVWRDGVTPEALPSLGGSFAAADAVNAAGDASGDATTAEERFHAVLWPVEGGILDLQDRPDATRSIAFDVNDQRTIVGLVVRDDHLEGFRWTPPAPPEPGLTYLHPLPGDRDAVTRSINNAGVSVGQSSTPNPAPSQEPRRAAVRWEAHPADDPVDLQTLLVDGTGWVLVDAVGISEAGHIVGTGIKDGQFTGFVLTPVVQEPPVAPAAQERKRGQERPRGPRR